MSGQIAPTLSSQIDQRIRLDQLFNTERWPDCWWQILLATVYSPVGVILLLMRSIIGVHVFLAACLLRMTSSMIRCFVLRIMCTILGIVVVQESRRDRNCSLIVANNISTLDHMAIDLVEPCILPSASKLPNWLRWCLGYADFGAPRRGRQQLIDQARQFCKESTLPLLTLPEGAMTNGQRGLLKFCSWPFDASDTVQPVIISIWRPPFAQLCSSVLGAEWWQDVFYFLFVPISIFHLRWLPVMTRQLDETADEFALRVSQTMSRTANVVLTNYTSHDVVELTKRHVREQRLRSQSSAQSTNLSPSQLDEMAMRIKETFPHVTLHAIRADLERSKNTQTTVNRILDGSLTSQQQETASSKTQSTTMMPSSPCNWRRTYEERKWSIIEENRRKYMTRKNMVE